MALEEENRRVPADPSADPSAAPSRSYWRRTRRLTGALLALWGAVTFGVCYFARELQFAFFGWPFSFWAAAQGALVLYLLIVVAYAWAMDRLEQPRRKG